MSKIRKFEELRCWQNARSLAKTIYQIDCKKWEWGDMSDEQVEAMKYFGMSQAIWDDEGDEEPFELPVSTFIDSNVKDTPS